MKKFIIRKHSSELTEDTTTTESESYTEGEHTDTYSEDTEGEDVKRIYVGGEEEPGFTSIVDVNYKKPRGGTIQDNLRKSDVIKKLEGYISLKTMKEKKILTKLPIFKTWVKYINIKDRKFRTGGLLMKVSYPDYIMLVNTKLNLSWSVQLKDNVIYIPDPEPLLEMTRERREEQKIDDIKDKLYELYVNGKLTTKKN